MTNDDILLSVEQAAECAEVSVAAIRLWHRTGVLPEATRRNVGGRKKIMFAKGALEAAVRGVCARCGTGYRKRTMSQAFCSDACRKSFHRLGAHRPERRGIAETGAGGTVDDKGSTGAGRFAKLDEVIAESRATREDALRWLRERGITRRPSPG